MDTGQAIELIEQRVAKLQEKRSFRFIADAATRTVTGAVGTGAFQTFQEVLSKDGLSVIGQVFVPGAEGAPDGLDDEEAVELGYEYDASDADAVAFVEDVRDFDRSEALFREMRDEVSTPILRHDIIVDPYQICEAKCLGADAITLMADVLDDERLERFLGICDQLMMDAMVQSGSLDGIRRAVAAGAYLVCADIDPSAPGAPALEEVRIAVPEECLLVVSQGIGSVEDAKRAHEAGADAVIAGSFLVECYRDDTMREIVRAMRE